MLMYFMAYGKVTTSPKGEVKETWSFSKLFLLIIKTFVLERELSCNFFHGC
jgi:hypothetical protein